MISSVRCNSLILLALAATASSGLCDRASAASGLSDSLTLVVDSNTGEVRIENSPGFSSAPITFDYYEIASDQGGLNPAGWLTLHDQEIDKLGDGPGESWQVLSATNNQLSEIFALGVTQLPVGGILSLGAAYEPFGGAGDIVFQYGGPTTGLVTAPVIFLGFPPPIALVGDYNVNGIVDALDASVWAAHLGDIGGGIADGDQNGVVGEVDYLLIALNLGNIDGPGALTLADPSQAALVYNAATGNVQLDQSGAEGGVITAFFLNSGAGALLAGVADFPYLTPVTRNALSVPTEFDTGVQIGQIDVAAAGLPTTQFNLGAVLPPGLSLAELQAALDGSFYMPAPGHGPESFALVVVPEPSGMCLAVMLGALVARRRTRLASGPWSRRNNCRSPRTYFALIGL